MTRSVQLTISVSYKVASMDPTDIAVQLAHQIEHELKKAFPAVGAAFGNMINTNAEMSWLDPNE